MRFIFLIYRDEDQPHGSDPAFHDETRRAGVYLASGTLRPTLTATTLRFYNGKIQLSDGPALQTPLTLSGYVVLDVADERDAIEWASRIMAARTGAVEIRRVRP